MTCLHLACRRRLVVIKEEVGKVLSLQRMTMVWEMALAIHHIPLLQDGSAETRWTAEGMRVVGHIHLTVKDTLLATKEECSHHLLVWMTTVVRFCSDSLNPCANIWCILVCIVLLFMLDCSLLFHLLLPNLRACIITWSFTVRLYCTCFFVVYHNLLSYSI